MSTPINNTPKEQSLEEQIVAIRAEIQAEFEAKMAEEKAKAEEAVAEARAKAIELAKRNNELEESINKGTATKTIKGKFKGYSFEPGHSRVRNQSGELCDTQMLMDAANDKAAPAHADAVKTLTWLIDIEYAYLVK